MIGFDIYDITTGIVRYFSFKLILSSMILNWYFNKFWPLYVSLSCLIAWILCYHRLRSLNRQLRSKPLHIGGNRQRGAAVAGRDTSLCFTSTVSLTEFYCVPYCHNQIVDVNLQYDVCFKTVWHYRSSLIIVKYNNWILYLNFLSQFDNIYIQLYKRKTF